MSVSEARLVRAIRGPVILITLGVLFALNNFTRYRFHETWPVLLIVFGLLSLAGRGSDNLSRSAAPGRPGFPPYGFPPPPPPPPSSGGYRQSPYTGTSASGAPQSDETGSKPFPGGSQ